jgi:CheY-like chemotaxis protein
MMPVMDGKTLCEKTNDLKKERPFLTIMITARIMPNEREWIDRMTDTLFIEKPFSPKEILKRVEQYLGDQ